MTVRPLKLLQKLLRGTNRRSHTTPPTSEQSPELSSEQQHFRLLDLPPEILLNVAKHLGRGDIIVLSLSFGALREVINLEHGISLSFRQEESLVKARVLQHFTDLWSDRILCRRCGCLFDWTKRNPTCVLCPNLLNHTETESFRHDTFVYGYEKLYISREHIDLILRRHRLGVSYGILPSVLDDDAVGWYGVHRKTKARFVKGNLLFMCHTQVSVTDRKSPAERLGVLERSLCLHQKTRLRKPMWKAVWQFAATTAPTEKLELELEKCMYCATDAKVFARHLKAGTLMVELKVWRSFGDGEECLRMAEQMFQSNVEVLTEIPPDILSQRNLQVDFQGH